MFGRPERRLTETERILKTACSAICRVFGHSPVFRIGSDSNARRVLRRTDELMYEDKRDFKQANA